MTKNPALARAGVVAGLVVLLAASSLWSARAQQPAATESTFTGKSEALDTKGLSLSRRSFEAAARANWHAHNEGQLLFVQEGAMRVQVEGQKMRELKKGESVFLPGGVAHWHGAVPTQALQQISVVLGPGIKWMEPVNDQQYAGKAPRK